MGGRGTFAAGNSVPYTYKTVGKINGVKVLEGINGKHFKKILEGAQND